MSQDIDKSNPVNTIPEWEAVVLWSTEKGSKTVRKCFITDRNSPNLEHLKGEYDKVGFCDDRFKGDTATDHACNLLWYARDADVAKQVRFQLSKIKGFGRLFGGGV